MKLSRDFYTRKNVVTISKDLLGKYLITKINSKITAGIITETEAYAGTTDKACHAWGGRRTKRTEVMYQNGGVAYVYLCYGIHHLFNVVTNKPGVPHAILIRSVKPVSGINTILRRRGQTRVLKTTSSGPGTLTQALGIHSGNTGTSLLGDKIWIEDRGVQVARKTIMIRPRVGVSYAEEDALLPYRFTVEL